MQYSNLLHIVQANKEKYVNNSINLNRCRKKFVGCKEKTGSQYVHPPTLVIVKKKKPGPVLYLGVVVLVLFSCIFFNIPMTNSMGPPPPKNPNPPETAPPSMPPPDSSEPPPPPPPPPEPSSDSQNPPSQDVAVPYKIPPWSAAPGHEFYLEVLKEGSIIDKFNVFDKGAYMFGRLDLCDFVLEHPTISRFHAGTLHSHTFLCLIYSPLHETNYIEYRREIRECNSSEQNG